MKRWDGMGGVRIKALALTIALGVSATAHAQSSVTLYGILDAGISTAPTPTASTAR
ncbi:putative porin [Paraburkholderia bannensis]|uniref:Putative porin n=1 Tax=Paraburkholderia bannensis TaxID=765414 RepID=A0A7W9U3L6_9BURK|nr:putative porin [Paraburkholderia sp. WP4_3_2]MBB6105320.1 putative porin [Paraburkholderia bannensis]